MFHRCRYEPAMRATDERVAAALQGRGIEVRSHAGLLMREPEEVRVDMTGRWVGHFGTLSPFMRCAPEPITNLKANWP